MTQASDVLDIKQAAAFLQVSETSLRRWTNAGRLPCFRLGGRHERRFRRADLVAFLEGSTAGMSQAAGHLCGLYTDDGARLRQATAFLAADVGPDSRSVLVAAREVRDGVLAALERRRPALRDDLAAGRLVISEYADSASAQLEFWAAQCRAAQGAGAHSVRIVGDVSGGPLARAAAFAAVLAYENDYDRLIARRFPVVTLCLHDARTLSGVEAAAVLRCHGDAFRYPVEHLVS